jgi:phasin family protein
MEQEMADTRNENKPHQNHEEKSRQTAEQAAEQARRVGLAAAQVSEDVSRASADVLHQNAETFQNAWRFGLGTLTEAMNRSTDEFGRTFGWTGDEAQQATEKSVRNTQSIVESAKAVSKGVDEISREYLQFARQQMEKNLDRMNELWRCRTPHEFAAVQSKLVRDTMTEALESGRRVADMSLKVADDAGKRIRERAA